MQNKLKDLKNKVSLLGANKKLMKISLSSIIVIAVIAICVPISKLNFTSNEVQSSLSYSYNALMLEQENEGKYVYLSDIEPINFQ